MLRILLFVLIPVIVIGQERNQKMLEFAEMNLGKKVGIGLCEDLVEAAAKYSGVKIKQHKLSLFSSGYYQSYGKKIKYDNVIPGDIIYYKRSSLSNSHFAIIKSVDENGDLELYEQAGNMRPKDRMVRVVEEDFRNAYDVKMKTKFYFYRP
jgi:hypothetical protein